MQKYQLWTSDIYVTWCCLGTMTRWHQNTEQDAHRQLDYAIWAGVNFIDTAEIYPIPPTAKTYTRTESYIGTWLQKSWARDQVVLASKMAGHGRDYIREGRWIHASDLPTAVQQSLDRLQTDYIDLYQLHRPQRPVSLWGDWTHHDDSSRSKEEITEHMTNVLLALKPLLASWTLRTRWLSNETTRGTMQRSALCDQLDMPRPVSIQNAYSLVRREAEVDLAEYVYHEKTAFLAYSPLWWWVLSGKYMQWAYPEGSRYATRGKHRMQYYMNDATQARIQQFAHIAKKHDLTMTQLSLARCQSRDFVTSTIIWATHMDQLKECISAFDIVLDPEVMKEIDAGIVDNIM